MTARHKPDVATAHTAVASPGSGSRGAGNPSSAYQKEMPPLTTRPRLLAELLMPRTDNVKTKRDVRTGTIKIASTLSPDEMPDVIFERRAGEAGVAGSGLEDAQGVERRQGIGHAATIHEKNSCPG